MQQDHKDVQSGIGKRWLEGLAMAILLFAIVRIIYYIGIGFDPHHDYYAFAPGLYFSEGLQPHKDFYTHYGPIDAAFKGVLITFFWQKPLFFKAKSVNIQLFRPPIYLLFNQ